MRHNIEITTATLRAFVFMAVALFALSSC